MAWFKFMVLSYAYAPDIMENVCVCISKSIIYERMIDLDLSIYLSICIIYMYIYEYTSN